MDIPDYKLNTISSPCNYAEQNVETSLRATVSEVSVSLAFHDEDPDTSMEKSKPLTNAYEAVYGRLSTSNIISAHANEQDSESYMSCFSSLNLEQSTIAETRLVNPSINHLEARCQNLHFNLQVKLTTSALTCTSLLFISNVCAWINFLFLTKPTDLSSEDQFPSHGHVC